MLPDFAYSLHRRPASGMSADLIITCVFSELPLFNAPTEVYPLRSKNGTADSSTRAKFGCA